MPQAPTRVYNSLSRPTEPNVGQATPPVAAITARRRVAALALLAALCAFGTVPRAVSAAPPRPNILFIIMDDVGMDQLRAFGYGGPTPPSTPNIDRIASAGIRFSNTWSMPACSTSRAVFFTGRFPLRTNVYGALGPSDLANSQVSPFETTTPKLLKMRGYRNAIFGKFHLGLQAHNPYRDAMPAGLGWDYFSGWLDETGDPASTDTTAGGVAPEGTWPCGFVPGAGDRSPKHQDWSGADTGACYAADNTCRDMTTSAGIPPGRACQAGGGVFDPGKACQVQRPANINFSTLSAHYVSPLVINHEDGAVEAVPPTDIRARTYRGTVPVDAAIEWIRRQPEGTPWMATVSFASAHTPLVQPPPGLLASGAAATSGLDCASVGAQRVLANQMIEAVDTEVGRLLVATGLARRVPQGGLDYVPGDTDTMIIIVGDNGSLGTTVKPPFDPNRAKGTAYQTGVWVPLVVAGPLVTRPDRDVTHMVNIADLFQLFGDIAGLDVPASVPRPVDSVAMLPYLVDPARASIRTWNFTQVGANLQANGSINGPCVFTNTCSQIPVTKGVCEDNGGTWWGAGSAVPGLPPEGLTLCCEVNVWLTQHATTGQTPTYYTIQPLSSIAIRNDRYKIVRNSTRVNDAAHTTCVPSTTNEFYAIDEAVPSPRLDRAELDLMRLPQRTPEQQANYDALSVRLNRILASQAACHADGNIDGEVNGLDVAGWNAFSVFAQGRSSWYDVNLDGATDVKDISIIQGDLGTACQPSRTACSSQAPRSGFECVEGEWVPRPSRLSR